MDRYAHVILVTVLVGIPLGALVGAFLYRRRVARGWDATWARRATIAEVGAVVGTVPWVWMILTPASGAGGLQTVPFRDLIAVLQGDDSLEQVVGNLLVFAALGFFLPIRFRMRGAGPVLVTVALVAAAGSVLVEALQLLLPLGRVASIDDVLLNTVGAVLGALLSMRWWRARETPRADAATGVQ